MIEWVGSWPPKVKAELERFAEALAAHPRGYPVEGRMAIVSDSNDDLEQWMAELERWMMPAAFSDYRKIAKEQPVVASGKAIVAQDGLMTAVVARFDDFDDRLVLCSHELIEMADHRRRDANGWEYPTEARELLGTIFADEYATERLREELAQQLEWPFAGTHDEMAIVDLATQIRAAMPTPRYDPPHPDFWAHWQTLARLWAMTCARRLTSPKADKAIRAWSKHEMIDGGWAPVERALSDLYEQGLERDELVEAAAERVWDPIERYGREAWTLGLGPGPG